MIDLDLVQGGGRLRRSIRVSATTRAAHVNTQEPHTQHAKAVMSPHMINFVEGNGLYTYPLPM